jgi:hypothetical protein
MMCPPDINQQTTQQAIKVGILRIQAVKVHLPEVVQSQRGSLSKGLEIAVVALEVGHPVIFMGLYSTGKGRMRGYVGEGSKNQWLYYRSALTPVFSSL